MAVTLAELRTRVQHRLAEPIAAGHWFTPETVNSYINDAIREVFLRIVEVNPDFFGVSTESFQTVTNQETYSLTGDVFEIRYVAIDNQRLAERTIEERFRFNIPGRPRMYYWYVNYTGTPTTQIGLLPPPDGVYTVDVWYIPRPKKLVNDTDFLDMPDELADIIVPFATALALKADKQAYQQEEAEYQVRMTRYLSFVARGKSGGPQYVNYTFYFDI